MHLQPGSFSLLNTRFLQWPKCIHIGLKSGLKSAGKFRAASELESLFILLCVFKLVIFIQDWGQRLCSPDVKITIFNSDNCRGKRITMSAWISIKNGPIWWSWINMHVSGKPQEMSFIVMRSERRNMSVSACLKSALQDSCLPLALKLRDKLPAVVTGYWSCVWRCGPERGAWPLNDSDLCLCLSCTLSVHCYELSCVPLEFVCWIPTPSTVSVFGDTEFKEVIKSKWDH